MDGTPDFRSLDSDADGLPDAQEGHDVDHDGTPDVTPAGVDTDGDGLDDAFDADCSTAAPCGAVVGVPAPTPDLDMNGLPDFQDPDDDGDGKPTAVEIQDATDYTGPATEPTDIDEDGLPNWFDTDSDGDGASDMSENSGDGDLNDDGILDYLDPGYAPTDTDGDGIPDYTECGMRFPPDATCVDSDGDGVPDWQDVDDDNDGVLTIVEYGADDPEDGDPANDRDADNDGIPNHLDLDADNDGIPDITENGNAAADADGDGRADVATDADMDGLLALFDMDDMDAANVMTVAPVNTDMTGAPDFLDLDADGDGLLDILEANGTDTDGDGVVDDTADVDMDGLADVVDGSPWPTPDTDDEGAPDFQDVDSDNDGASDAIEATDVNGDGVADILPSGTDANGNGIDDVFEIPGNTPSEPDNDMDGTPDWRDLDDDDDGVPSAIEVMAGDTDMDGVPDYLDTDDDGDTVPTAMENPDPDGDGDPADAQDTDRNGVPDYLDPDDDGDGLLTRFEEPDPNGDGNPDDARDTDSDSTPDYLDPDDDGDGLPTADEMADPNGDGDPADAIDIDGNGTPNYLDPATAGGLSGGAFCAAPRRSRWDDTRASASGSSKRGSAIRLPHARGLIPFGQIAYSYIGEQAIQARGTRDHRSTMSADETHEADLLEPIWQPTEYLGFSDHEHAEVRSWALGRLTLLHPEIARAPLVGALEDLDPFNVYKALNLIEALDPPPLEALRAFLSQDDIRESLRLKALHLLSSNGDVEAAAQLELPEDTEADADEEDDYEPPRATTPQEAPALHQRAVDRLGGPDGDETKDLLFDLMQCPWSWAPRILEDRLDTLLGCEVDDLAWNCVRELGDPTLLDAVLRAWRPGEPDIASTAVFLARLGGRLDDVPVVVQEECRTLLHRLDDGQLRSGPLELRLRCTACGRAWTHEVDKVYVDPEVVARSGEDSAGADWDGMVLSSIIVCKGCGGRDQYELTPVAHVRIMTALLARRASGGTDDSHVVLAKLRLWDGTTFQRPTSGLEHLRALAEQQPELGEAWRRLGNMCERFELHDEAEEAWRRAVDDPKEAEAAHSLACKLMQARDVEAALDFTFTAIERMPKAELDDEIRGDIAANLCGILRDTAPYIRPPIALMASWTGEVTRGREIVVHVSTTDLRNIPDWDYLAELISGRFFLSLGFSHDLPEDDDSQLVDLLGRALPAARLSEPMVRSGPKVGRNDPCPCGSGRKHKRCCLRR